MITVRHVWPRHDGTNRGGGIEGGDWGTVSKKPVRGDWCALEIWRNGR